MEGTQISPKEAAEKNWFLDVYDGAEWQLADFGSHSAMKYTILNGKWDTKELGEALEIAPVFTHTPVKYLKAEEIFPNRSFRMLSQKDYFGSLSVCKLQELTPLDLYQTINSSLPLFLKVTLLEAEKSNIAPDLHNKIEIWEELLLWVIPSLPREYCKGALKCLWPGVLEIVKLVFSVVSQFDQIVREKGDKIGKLLTNKVLEVDITSFRYGDLSEFFLIFATYIAASQSEDVTSEVISFALSLSSNSDKDEEESIQESLSCLLSLLESTPCFSHFLQPWGSFLTSVNWTKIPVPLINTISKGLKSSPEVANHISERGLLRKALEMMDAADSKAMLALIKENPGPFYSTYFLELPPEAVASCSLRDEYILGSIENRMWEEVQRMISAGIKSSLFGQDPGRQSLLLTLALGRSMPVPLLFSFFDYTEITDLSVLLLISSRYIEIDQTYLLSRVVSRQVILTMLNNDRVTSSEAFHNPDVQFLLRIVLFRDRFALLWLHAKLKWTHRIPLGVLRSVIVGYL